MLLDERHGAEIMNSRKALVFAGFTHKSPCAVTYLRADKAFNFPTYGRETVRGPTTAVESPKAGRGRAISM